MEALTAKARISPRLRMNLDLRNSLEDKSQRLLNAIEPGAVLPIHRHRNTSETVICLRGHLREYYYDEKTHAVTEIFDLTPNGPVYGLNIPAGQWHGVESMESGTVIMEVKDGAYEPISAEDILQ